MPNSKIDRKRIIIICPHPERVAPAQRLKYEQYFDYLRDNGYILTISPFMTRSFWDIVYKRGNLHLKVFWTLFGYIKRIFDLIRIPFYDGVYVFLWVAPLGPPIFEWIAGLVSKKIVYDIDDLVFLKPKNEVNPYTSFLKSKNNSIYLMKKADHVITCTPYLDKFVKKYNLHTTDISSTINTHLYRPKNNYEIVDRKITLGWSGSFSTSKYLYLLTPVFHRLKEKYDFRLVVMGDTDFYIEGIDLETIPWKESHEVKVISQFDIGLYPLPDEEWVYGKSGLKALQYMALGIPTIATAIGTNFRIIHHGESGFLVKTEDEWYETIVKLIEDQSLRERIGTKAALRVEKYYSVNANKNTYLDIFNKTYLGEPYTIYHPGYG